MKKGNGLTLLAVLMIFSACTENPSVLNAVGPHAAKTAGLFWFFLWVEAIVAFLVLGFLFVSLYRRRTCEITAPEKPTQQTEKRLTIGVTTAVVATILILTSFVVVSYAVDRQMIDLDTGPEVVIEVTARQWWWDLRYESAEQSEIFKTANEIHVPVGKKVRLLLKSSDVIHSLWFPNLSGKKDIMPGRDQDLYIRADREGTWLGRCAEFCGLQHARMELRLIAESNEKFEAWKTQQRLPAVEPATAEEIRGRNIFVSTSCNLCHTIRQVNSTGYSSNAPDLTHLKSRATIGAGAAPNDKGSVGGWIIDPHGLKPGVHMPTNLQEPKDFQALLTYLESLK